MSDEKKWMSRAELDRNLRKVAASEHFIDAHEFSSKIYREHAAIIDECERLERYNTDGMVHNQELRVTIQKQQKEIEGLKFDAKMAELAYGKMKDKYEPEQLDDRDTAEKKANEHSLEMLKDGEAVRIIDEKCGFRVVTLRSDVTGEYWENECFVPYAPKREPEKGDLVLYADGDKGSAVIPVIIEEIEEGLISNVVGYCLGVDECTPTPYRLVDGEIVRRRG